jgi:hypothetical protein
MEERVTIAAPDGAVKELDMPSGRRYKARDGGLYDVAPRDAKYVKGIGGFVPNVGPMVLSGPRCPGCGFASYFVTCSRCGADRRDASMAMAVLRTHAEIRQGRA